VKYAENGRYLVVFGGRPREKRCWRNLRGGAPVELVLRGDHLRERADVASKDDASEVEAVALYPAQVPRGGSAPAAG
jgi:hypothetical protein